MPTGHSAWELLLQLTPLQSVSKAPAKGKSPALSMPAWHNTPIFRPTPPAAPASLPAAHGPAVAALVQGRNSKTVILLNHHDVVAVDDYGTLRTWPLLPSG